MSTGPSAQRPYQPFTHNQRDPTYSPPSFAIHLSNPDLQWPLQPHIHDNSLVAQREYNGQDKDAKLYWNFLERHDAFHPYCGRLDGLFPG